jgi:hypothetical protein
MPCLVCSIRISDLIVKFGSTGTQSAILPPHPTPKPALTPLSAICISCAFTSDLVGVGFPFYVKKLFTRNIVTDVTDGYYVVITVVTT